MKMYRTGGFREPIEEVEVVRATDKSVWLDFRNGKEPRRCAIKSSYDSYWHSLEEAKDYLRAKCERTIEACEDKIESAKALLADIDAL